MGLSDVLGTIVMVKLLTEQCQACCHSQFMLWAFTMLLAITRTTRSGDWVWIR